jgi:hypothetical protein
MSTQELQRLRTVAPETAPVEMERPKLMAMTPLSLEAWVRLRPRLTEEEVLVLPVTMAEMEALLTRDFTLTVKGNTLRRYPYDNLRPGPAYLLEHDRNWWPTGRVGSCYAAVELPLEVTSWSHATVTLHDIEILTERREPYHHNIDHVCHTQLWRQYEHMWALYGPK